MNTQLINHPQAAPLPAPKFAPKDLISTRDLSPKDAEGLLHLAGLMKARPADFRDAPRLLPPAAMHFSHHGNQLRAVRERDRIASGF